MTIKNISLWSIALLFSVCLISSCKSSSGLNKDKTPTETYEALRFGKKIIENAQTSQYLTSKIKARVQIEGKDITLNGNLRMKRDDVIQISLNMFGFEIGRLEFLTNEVLIIDRVHRQFVKVPYGEVDFLNNTNIDFKTLQSIFWSEIFVPGTNNLETELKNFSIQSSGEHTLLCLKSAPKLEYDFLAETETALLNRITIRPKEVSEPGEFVCKYAEYTKFKGKSFPYSIDLNFNGEGIKAELTLTLSGLNDKSDWETRTVPGSKYKQISAKGILNKLMQQ